MEHPFLSLFCPAFDENSADLKRQTLGSFTQRGPFYQQTKGKYEATRIVGKITTQKLGVWGRILKWWNYVALPFLRLSGTKMGSQEKQLKNGENSPPSMDWSKEGKSYRKPIVFASELSSNSWTSPKNAPKNARMSEQTAATNWPQITKWNWFKSRKDC